MEVVGLGPSSCLLHVYEWRWFSRTSLCISLSIEYLTFILIDAVWLLILLLFFVAVALRNVELFEMVYAV